MTTTVSSMALKQRPPGGYLILKRANKRQVLDSLVSQLVKEKDHRAQLELQAQADREAKEHERMVELKHTMHE